MNLKDNEVTLVKIYTSAGMDIVSFDDYQEALDIIKDIEYPVDPNGFLLIGNVYVRYSEIIKIVFDKEVLNTELVIKSNPTLDSPDMKGTRIYMDGESYQSGLKFLNSDMYKRELRVTNNSEYNFTAEDIKELKNKVNELEDKVSELTEANSKLEKLTLTYFSEIFKELVRASNLEIKKKKLGK